MSVFKTAYHTTACSGFVMRKTIEALQNAQADGQLAPGPANTRLVEGGSSAVNAVPPFGHPVLFEDAHRQQLLALDVRSFGNWDDRQNIFRVRNQAEYNLLTTRGRLNQLWLTQSPSILRDLSSLPLTVFCSWVSEALARRYALDPAEQMKLSILAAVFYMSLFTEETEISEQDKIRIAAVAGRTLRLSAKDTMEVLDQIGTYVSDVGAFCNLAVQVTGSVRLQELNVGVLYSVLGGSWFGTNAKENIAVALEHPPTWLALVAAAAGERTFKQSALAKLVERLSGKDGGKTYVAALQNMLERIA